MFYQSARDGAAASDPLYSSQQRFYLKTGYGEERPRDLRINVYLTSAYSAASKHVLNLQVLDDDDPFFYYALAVTEDDYVRLKSSQGLLVDFNNFPTQVVRLLEQCKNQESNPAKFLLMLEEEERGEFAKTMLRIVETNNFKHLCHLVLQIDHGSDEEIKKIMVKKIKSLKDQNYKADKVISSLESQLSSKNMMLDAAERKVNEVEHRWKEEKMAFQAAATRGMTDEAEKLRRAQLDWQIKSQREIAEVEEKLQSMIREKDAELSKLRIDSQISYDKRSHAEATMYEQGKRIEVLESELTAVRGDLGNARKQLAKMENQLHEKERIVSSLKGKFSIAEQESKEKAMLMSRQEDLLKTTQEAKARLEGSLQEKEAYIAKKQKTIQSVSEELIKANEIIAKLQKDLNTSITKLKTRTEIALEQEKVIERHKKTIEKLEKELKVKSKKLETSDESEVSLKTTIAKLKESLDAKEKKIKENEKIIDWLNRRCTEVTVQSYLPYSKMGGNQSHGIIGPPETVSGTPFTTNAPTPLFSNSATPADASGIPGQIHGNPSLRAARGDIKTSTPLEQFKDVRTPFTPPSRLNILALDKMETPVILEEESSENEDPSPKPKETKNALESDKKKASPVDPPKISCKPLRKSGPNKKPPNQTPTVPSSYFLS